MLNKYFVTRQTIGRFKMHAKGFDTLDTHTLSQIGRGREIIIILSTQRTGSTLLCDKIAQYLKLSYAPTESLLPYLRGLCSETDKNNSHQAKLYNYLYKLGGAAEPLVINVMYNYLGLAGYMLDGQQKQGKLYMTYCQDFLNALCREASQVKLIHLSRKGRLDQGISQYLNSFGFETHVKTRKEKDVYAKKVWDKLQSYDETSIVKTILFRVWEIYEQETHMPKIYDGMPWEITRLTYEEDLCDPKDSYLPALFGKAATDLQAVSSLKVTRSKANQYCIDLFKAHMGLANGHK